MSEPAVRSAAEPMAFSHGEFLRGAVSAWLWFLGLDIAAWMFIYLPSGGVVAAIYVLGWATVGLVVFAAPAWWLGRALRRTHRIGRHLAAFAVFGAGVGVVVTALFFFTLSGRLPLDPSAAVVYVVNTTAAAAAVTLGWRRGARDVLRPDVPQERGDPDAQVEDALVERAQAPQENGTPETDR